MATKVETNPHPAPLKDEKPLVEHVEASTDLVTGHQLDDAKSIIGQETAAPAEKLNLIQAFRKFPLPSILAFAGAFSAISDGYQIQMTGSIIALPGFIDFFGLPQPNGTFKLDPQTVAIWGAMKSVFSIVGAGLAIWPNERFGRKPLILAIQIIFVGATFAEMYATNWTHWLAARMLDGVANGINASVLNVYVAEMAPTGGRGALLAMYSLWYAMGQLVCVIALNIVTGMPRSQWRHAVYSQWATIIICIMIWFFLPETPRFLCQRGKHDQAKNVLKRLYKRNADYDVDKEYVLLQNEIEVATQVKLASQGGSWMDLVRSRQHLRRLYISFVPYAWQVALGVPVTLSYSAYFFQLAGLQNPFLGTLAVNLVLIASLITSLYVLERIGRRLPLLIGGGICISCVCLLGGVLKLSTPGVGAALIVLCCVWVASYALSAGPMGYTYTSETASVRMRAKTTGTAIALVQAWQILFTYTTPLMLNAPAMGLSNTAFFYVATGLLGWLNVYFFVPELKGRVFSEIDELFDRRISARKFAETETAMDLQRKEAAGRGEA